MKKVIIAILMMFVFIIFSSEQKVYAYEMNPANLTSIKDMYNAELKLQYPYLVVLYFPTANEYAYFFGNKEFGYFNDGTNESFYVLEYPTIGLTYRIWRPSTETLVKPINITLYNGNVYRVAGPTHVPTIVYSNFDLKNVTYNTGTSTFEVGSVLHVNDETPVYEDLGYPLKFRYFMPGMYGQSAENALLIGNNLHDFQATWENSADVLNENYKVQLQYKGTYDVKKEWILGVFSGYKRFTTVWHDIAEEDATALHWWKDEMYIDYGKEAPIYLDLKAQAGFTPSLTSMKQISGTMRIRYVSYDDEGNVVGLGKWVSATLDGEGANVVVVEEDGTIIPTEEYGETGTDYTGEELNDNALEDIASSDKLLNSLNKAFTSIGTWLGQVPTLMGNVFTFLPPEILAFMTLAIGLVIVLRIMGR